MAEIVPSASLDPVRSYTSQPWATICIQVPINDNDWPMNQRR